jgi:hypothetical protein
MGGGGAAPTGGSGGTATGSGGAPTSSGGGASPGPDAAAGGARMPEAGSDDSDDSDGSDGKSETGTGPAWTGTLRGRIETSSSAHCVAVHLDGTVLVGATSLRQDGAQQGRGFLIRVDPASGAFVVHRVPVAKFVSAVAFGPEGDLFFAGISEEAGLQRLMIGRYRSSGEPRWTTVLGGDKPVGSPESIGVASDGSVAVSGEAPAGLPLEDPSRTGAGYVVKLSPEGVHLWTSRRDGRFSAVDGAGNVYVMESGVVPGLPTFGGKDHAGLVKLSPGGQRLWKTLLEYPADVNPAFVGLMNGSSVAIDADGVISAAADMQYSRCIPNECATQPVLARFAADGTLKQAVLLGPETARLVRTGQTRGGTRLFARITGPTTIGALGGFSSDGTLLWGSLGLGALTGSVADVQGDAAGDAIVVGLIPEPGNPSGADWFIERRRGSNGTLY